MTCQKCKTVNQKNYKFCYNCGAPLKQNVVDKLSETLLTEHEVQALLKYSYVFEINSLVDEAIEAYSAIAEKHPGWADVRFKLARAYEAKGQYGKAIAEYRKALSINDDYIEAHRCLGELYSDEGFYEEAIEQFEIVLNKKHKFLYADVHNNIGVSLNELGNIDGAIEEFQKAIEINPEYSEANYNLSGVYYKKGDFEKAKEYISKAVETAPDHEKYKELANKVIQ